MKSLFLLITLVSVVSFAKGFTPYCTNIGTRSEGWKMPNGSVKWDNCSKKVAVCAAVGSKSEGWYSAEVLSSQLIGWDNCSEDNSKKPKCAHVGTRSEGWTLPNGRIAYDNCSEKIAVCSAIGSRSEGWYAVELTKKAKRLLGWAQCSK